MKLSLETYLNEKKQDLPCEEKFTMPSSECDKIALLTAVKTYKNKQKNLEIKLAGDCHVGEESYFKEMTEELRLSDKILYEGVKPLEIPFKSKLTLSYLFLKSLHKHYDTMKKSLGLSFRLDYMAKILEEGLYAEKLEHCDVDVKEFINYEKTLWEKGIYLGFIIGSPLIGFLIKLEPELVKSQMILSLGNEKSVNIGKAIMESRNEKVQSRLDELCKENSNYKIGVIYGALHMPHFSKHITQKLGFEKVAEKWLKVFETKMPKNDFHPSRR